MITVLGLGFVGLTTGLGFAKKGFKTFGFDINEERLNQLKNLEIPFHEPFLKEVLTETYNKNFFLDVSFSEAIKRSKAIFICVGTPGKEDGSADLTYVYNAIEQILNIETDNFQVIITKSTVPPSTVSKKVIPFVKSKLKKLPKRKIGFASNPEFLREGYCWEDFIQPDRIVIGVKDDESKKILNKIYEPFKAPIHYVSYNSAEFIKYLSNTLLSTLVSFANEMSMVATSIGDIDIAKAFRVLHEDKRWFGQPAEMAKYVYPGCGYGGYCLPKDTSAIAKISMENGFEPKMLHSTIDINERIKPLLVSNIIKKIKPTETIGILGLSFKPHSDDVRFTASHDIIELLMKKGYNKIIAYDPIAIEEFRKHYPKLNITYSQYLDEIIDRSDALVLTTAWPEFKKNKNKILKKPLFDLRYSL